jgi:hypothetical protein
LTFEEDRIVINQTEYRIRGKYRIAVLAMTGALMALPALAADSEFDDAYAHLVKASAILNATANAADAHAVGTHRELAIRLIQQAEGEIARAKQAADAPPAGSPGLHTLPRTNTSTLPNPGKLRR